MSDDRRRLFSRNYSLEDVIWPGGSTTIPKGYVMQVRRKKLRIAVPSNNEFRELIYVDHDPHTNATVVSGFCFVVFVATMNEIQYEEEYEFIQFLQKENYGSNFYIDLVHQVNLKKYDAAIGDITITGNRSLEVDFTLPFTKLGVGIVAAKDTKSMWVFLKGDLWLLSVGFFILTGFIIWLIEHGINTEFQDSVDLSTKSEPCILLVSFSTLIFAQREKLVSNLSRFILIVWVFVVLILTSSYTATLTSMITVKKINTQLNSKESYVGYQVGSLTQGVIDNQNFMKKSIKPIVTPEGYANALSKGSKNGGVSAIIDEIPYLKTFLAKYSNDYFMVGHTASTNGFGFVIPKGSPLVPELSRAIAKLRDDRRLAMMENAWRVNQH